MKKGRQAPSHTALYRKYRSKSLNEVVGQRHITDILSRAINENKLSHAYLFTGPRGVGKTSVARILAHDINGLPYDDDNSHLDIIEIDAASNNGVDDIRDLRDKVQITPVSAKKKVYIIDEVHMLSKPAFNALLKTLEEPPEHIVFILATTDADKLPDTIISRTQRFNFRTISTDEAASHLGWIAEQEGFSVDAEALHLIATHGGGSFRDSINLLDQLCSVAGSKTNISRQSVEDLLGMPPEDLISKLLAAHESANIKEVIDLLITAETSGSQPVVIANALIAAVREALPAKPQLIPLLDKLIDVAESSRPDIKLLVALSPEATKPAKTVALASATPVVSSPVLKRVVATPSNKKDEPKLDMPKAPRQEKPQTEFNWQDLLSYIKTHHVAISTLLSKCSHEINGDTLTIYTGNSFYKNKLDNARHRGSLAAALNELGMGELTIATIGSAMPPQDEVAASVAAIMGGGEEISMNEGSV